MKAEAFLQWKGTDACFDFTCECGARGHFDGYFAYYVKCTKCGAVYQMPTQLVPTRVSSPELPVVNINPDEEEHGL